MSIKIRQSIVWKINQEEYTLLMICRTLGFVPTEKGIKFLKFLKEKMPFGECQTIVKNGQPIRIERAVESQLFDEQPVDKSIIVEEKKGELTKV